MQVAGLTGVQAVAAGGTHSLALLGDGTVRAWGGSNVGQVGDGTSTTRTLPTTVGLSGVVAIAAGIQHSLARGVPTEVPVFSSVPTTREISQTRLLPEPLLPVGTPTEADNIALAAVLRALPQQPTAQRWSRITQRMSASPTRMHRQRHAPLPATRCSPSLPGYWMMA